MSPCHSPGGRSGGPVYFLDHSQMEPTGSWEDLELETECLSISHIIF